MPPLGAPKPPGGGGKPINLGIPDPNAAPPPAAAGPPPGDGGGPPPPAPDGGGGPGGPPGGGPGGPSGDLGAASENMNYPELNISGLDEGAGLQDLPDEGHARIHYKVTGRGKTTEKHGKGKGKTKHHANLEVHHITPEGDGKGKKSESDNIRDQAKKFFQAEDSGSRMAADAGPGGSGGQPSSEMPG